MGLKTEVGYQLMSDENNNPDHPLDGQYDNAEMAGAELVSSAKKAGLKEVELPIVDGNAVWAISAKKLGIIGSTDSSTN